MWKPNRITPENCEGIYEVLEVETGREIAVNVELDEANKIVYSNEMYEILVDSIDYMEKLYLSTKIKNQNELDDINNHLTNIYKLISNINKK